MQMFRQPVQSAHQGDRLGICVTHFDAKLFERGVVCSPGHLQLCYAAVIPIQRIKYFKQVRRLGRVLYFVCSMPTKIGFQ